MIVTPRASPPASALMAIPPGRSVDVFRVRWEVEFLMPSLSTVVAAYAIGGGGTTFYNITTCPQHQGPREVRRLHRLVSAKTIPVYRTGCQDVLKPTAFR